MVNKKLAKEILRRVKIDAAMRKRWRFGKYKTTDKQVDIKNTTWLKKTVAKHGWPTISLVGKEASHGAWLLAQHADLDVGFQKRVLKLLENIYKKNEHEVNRSDIAYLTDRVLVRQNKPQIFGTQFRKKAGETKFKPLPIKDFKNVDRRRKEYGLSTTFKENTKEMNRLNDINRKKHILRFRSINRDIFNAIKSGKKKIETRAGSMKYRSISKGDIAVLVCSKSKFEMKINLVQKFSSIKALLRKYKPFDINPKIKTAAELQKMYSSFPGYDQKIRKYGLVVVGLKN